MSEIKLGCHYDFWTSFGSNIPTQVDLGSVSMTGIDSRKVLLTVWHSDHTTSIYVA